MFGNKYRNDMRRRFHIARKPPISPFHDFWATGLTSRLYYNKTCCIESFVFHPLSFQASVLQYDEDGNDKHNDDNWQCTMTSIMILNMMISIQLPFLQASQKSTNCFLAKKPLWNVAEHFDTILMIVTMMTMMMMMMTMTPRTMMISLLTRM